MNATLRLLIPDKKGIHKRVDAAVREGGGQLVHFRVRRKMRGISEAEIGISCVDRALLPSVLSQLGRIPGVALLSSDDAGPSATASS